MWQKEYSQTYQDISKKEVWEAWVDINNWHLYHDDLDYCKLEGKFEEGNHFLLKPKGMGPVKIDLIEIKEMQEFTDCTRFFGAKMYDTHYIKETKEGILIGNKVKVTGILKWLWVFLVARNVAASVPQEMDNMVKYIKNKRDGSK